MPNSVGLCTPLGGHAGIPEIRGKLVHVDDSAPDSHCNGFGAIMNRQFRENVLDVALSGLVADPQVGGYLPVALTPCNKMQNLDLAIRQCSLEHPVGQTLSD